MGDHFNCMRTEFTESELAMHESHVRILKNDESCLRYVLSLNREEKIKFVSLKPAQKSNVHSMGRQTYAMTLYLESPMDTPLDEIIRLYTESIVFAKPRSWTLASAYANRSGALHTAGLYDDCLQDIARALSLTYPKWLAAKLYARRARCLMALNKENPSRDYKEEIEEALKLSQENMTGIRGDNLGRSLVRNILDKRERMVRVEGSLKKWQNERFLPSVAPENATLVGVSSALRIDYSRIKDRHLLAFRDIEPGEVLAVIEPYVGILVTQRRLTHCDYCMAQTWSSIPCEDCCEVVYCNQDCKNKAYHEYHDIECQVMGHLINANYTIAWLLALRLTIRAVRNAGGIKRLADRIAEFEECKDTMVLGLRTGLLSNNYASVYASMKGTYALPPDKAFDRALGTCYILQALATESQFFGRRYSGNFKKLENDTDMLFIGTLIMRHVQIALHNGRHFYEETVHGPVPRALVVLPLHHMNHSCNPGITRVGFGTTVVHYANHAIKKGEEVFDNYGPSFLTMPRHHRQSMLRNNYHSTCRCLACTEDWPTRCRLPSIDSLSDETRNRIRKLLEQCAGYASAIKQNELPEDFNTKIAVMNRVLSNIQEIIKLQPYKEIYELIEVRNKYLRLVGNRFQSVLLNESANDVAQ